MADKPIIFSAPMIRALLDGRKTQTRRVLNPQPESPHDKIDALLKWRVGDRLWVREGWNVCHKSDLAPGEIIERPLAECIAANGGFAVAACHGVVYRATGAQEHPTLGKARWRSPVHMPRWASRMTLEVTEVRVQRLQEISTMDAIAEGIGLPWVCGGTLAMMAQGIAKDGFRALWNSLHGPDAWDENPWVCALTFTVHRCNIDQMPGASNA